MSSPNQNMEEILDKFKKYRNIIEKFTIIGVCSLWLIACFWDLIKLSCYWSDYCLEIYSGFVIVFILLHTVMPAKVPAKIYSYIGCIAHTYGRGGAFIIISCLFMGDEHFFHKFAAILLFIGGLVLIGSEICVPTKKEEKFKLPEENNNNEGNKNDDNNNNKDNPYNTPEF